MPKKLDPEVKAFRNAMKEIAKTQDVKDRIKAAKQAIIAQAVVNNMLNESKNNS